MTAFVTVDDGEEVKDALADLLQAAGVRFDEVRDGHELGAADPLRTSGSDTELVSTMRRAAIDLRRAAALAGDTVKRTPGSLSPREREVLELAARGLTADGIAAELFLSAETVRTHTRNAIRKLGARNRLHAVVMALSAGTIAAPTEAPPL